MGQSTSKMLKSDSDKHINPCRNCKLKSSYNGIAYYLCIGCNQPFQLQSPVDYQEHICQSPIETSCLLPIDNINQYPILQKNVKSDSKLCSCHSDLALNQHYIHPRNNLNYEAEPSLSIQNQVMTNLNTISNMYSNNNQHQRHDCCCYSTSHQPCVENNYLNENKQSSFVHPMNHHSNNSSYSNSRVNFQGFNPSSNFSINKPNEHPIQDQPSKRVHHHQQQLRTYASCSSFNVNKPNELEYQNGLNHHQQYYSGGIKKYRINHVDQRIVMIQDKK
ncbi:unnamed protein product [Cunninghamella blakesleeana]